ncbi:unnamed protein product [marine sediment metagenome]|uniref:HEPN domain-containing protein n=1 Tax=marine sediment metagenome TaxID=412755 RepID=X1SVD9_9ZZZZ
MPGEESLYPGDWLRIAEKDWKRVEGLLKEDPELAGFCLQQAVEKFFKAFLLSKGWRLRRIHSLDALLDDTLEYDPTIEGFRKVCQQISGFYFVERYPVMLESELTGKEVRDALNEVQGLIEKLRAGVEGR